jgi:hypothetical protein
VIIPSVGFTALTSSHLNQCLVKNLRDFYPWVLKISRRPTSALYEMIGLFLIGTQIMMCRFTAHRGDGQIEMILMDP